MDNLFARAMLSSTQSDLRTLFFTNRPNTEQLTELVIALTEQQARERLSLLLELLQENTNELSLILPALPPVNREALFEQLFDSIENDPPWLDALTSFILATHEHHSLNERMIPHVQKMALAVLRSAAAPGEEQVVALSLCLNTEQLVNLAFQLRAIAATWHTVDKNHENTRFGSCREIYHARYETLVMALTVRATAATSDYQALIANNSELANMLMSRRIKTTTSAELKKKLVEEIVSNCHLFNWQDATFSSQINTYLVDAFAVAATEDTCRWFTLYSTYHNEISPGRILRFIDSFFEKTLNIGMTLSLFAASKDENNARIINFIFQSQSRSPELTEHLLECLDVHQLIQHSGLILGLEHLLHPENRTIADAYCRILASKIKQSVNPRQLCSQWASALSMLSYSAKEEQINAAFFSTIDNPELQRIWLQKLLETENHTFTEQQAHINLLLPHCMSVLVKMSFDMQCSFFASLTFNNQLQLLLAANKKDRHAFAHLSSLLTETMLISVINQLVISAETDNLLKQPLNDLLLHLCKLLQKQSANETAPLHAWIRAEHNTLIARSLLANPLCFAELARRSTVWQDYTPSFAQGIISQDAKTDLKLRAACVLERADLNTETARNIAMALLHHFRHHPLHLQTLFKNLEDARPSFSAHTRQSYKILVNACWYLLHPEIEDTPFDLKAATHLLTHELGNKHCFDYFLTQLAGNLYQSSDSQQSALYLTEVNPDAIGQLKDHKLVSVLLQSVEDSTACNWQKVLTFLNVTSCKRNLSFTQTMISSVSGESCSASLQDKSAQFIMSLSSLIPMLPFLNDAELLWLLKHCSRDQLVNHFHSWADRLQETKRWEQLDKTALLMLLPGDPDFLGSLYQRPELKPQLSEFFIQLAQKETVDAAHFTVLSQLLEQQADAEKRSFLFEVQQQQHPFPMAAIVAPVLNRLLLNLHDLSSQHINNRILIEQHFQFITRQASSLSIQGLHLVRFQQELMHLLINTFHTLVTRDEAWAGILLDNSEFAGSTVFWLGSIGEHDLADHPFTPILLNHADKRMHPRLVQSQAYQRFINILLSNPPATMHERQFSSLFATLSAQAQQELAIDILQRSTLEDVQWFSLMTLSRALPVEILYQIFTNSKTGFVFVDLIFRHPQGVDTLSMAQKNALIQKLTSGQQVLRILDSHSPVSVKCSFVSALFQALTSKQTDLSAWLNHMKIDSQTLAALANFTVSPGDQRRLRAAIESNTWRHQFLSDYLHTPDLDMQLQPEGLLFALMKNAWLKPEEGIQCHSSLFALLDPETAKQVLKNQYYYLLYIWRLNSFYETLDYTHTSQAEMLTAAQWIHRLPLLAEGLFDVIHEYCNSSSEKIKKTIENSALYRHLVFPVLSGIDYYTRIAVSHISTDTLLQAETFFESYLAQIQTIQPEHYRRVLMAYQRYCQQTKIMLQLTPDNLLRHQEDPDPDLLVNISNHFQQKLAEKQIVPERRLQELMLCAMNHQQGAQLVNHLSDWVISEVLLSPLTVNWQQETLYQIMSCIPLARFTDVLESLQQRLQLHKKTFATLKSSASMPISGLLGKLTGPTAKNEEKKENTLQHLLNACELAGMPYMHALLTLLLKAQHAHITPETILSAFPHPETGGGMEMTWIQKEAEQLITRESWLLKRCQDLMTSRLVFRDDNENAERLVRLPRQQKRCDVAQCIASYLPVFSKGMRTTADQLLASLAQLLASPELMSSLANSLDRDLLQQAFLLAMDNPLQHEDLLRSLLRLDTHGTFQKALQIHLQQRLNLATPASQASLPNLEQINMADLTRLPESSLGPILIIQRLLYHLTPIAELRDWQAKGSGMQAVNRAFMAADASILYVLTGLAKRKTLAEADPAQAEQAKKLLQFALQFFKEHAKPMSYCLAGANLKPDQPQAFYYYLYLLAFLTDNNEELIQAFFSWLKQIEINELQNHPWLERLLTVILDKNLLSNLCQQLQKKKLLNEEQSAWLFATSMRLQPVDNALIKNLTLACSWSWLTEQMKASEFNRLNLLTHALNNEAHQQAILASETSMLDFLTLQAQFPVAPNETVRMIQSSNHPLLQSLLAIHLLNRPDYLSRISGPSLITLLSSPANKAESPRLRSLINYLDLATLPVSTLQNWLPEAAATLLCCSKSFHLLTAERMLPLFNALGPHRDAFVTYWLSRYSSMPGSETPLLILIQHASKRLLSALPTLPVKQRKRVIKTWIRHCNQLNDLNDKALGQLCSQCDASDLHDALTLFWQGRQQDPQLIQLIKGMINAAPGFAQNLSMETIQMIPGLGGQPAFEDIRPAIDQISGNYLKHAAMLANCSVFYDNNQLNWQRVTRVITFQKESAPVAFSGFGLFNQVKKAWNHLLTARSAEEESLDNPLMAKLPKAFDNISAINYFLVHYRGDESQLTHFLQDYFHALQQSMSTNNSLLVTSWLMNQNGMQASVQRTIFNQLLNYPALLRDGIAAEALRYDADTLLKHFGQTKQYAALTAIASSAIDILEEESIAKNMAARAIEEANFERSLRDITGFFARWRIWYRRCGFYGWQGFFRPRPPQFVARFDHRLQAEPADSPTLMRQTLGHTPQAQPTLANMLEHLTEQSSLADLSLWHKALLIYESQEHQKEEEYDIRPQVDKLYERILQRVDDQEVQHWLQNHHEALVENRRKLLALYCEDNHQEALNKLLSIAPEFDDFAKAFQQAPEIELLPQENPHNQPQQTLPGNMIYGLVSSLGNTLWKLGSFWSKKEDNSPAPPPSSESFASLTMT